MANMEDKPIPLVDNPQAPEVFAEHACGFLNIGGSIVITLECGKSDYSGERPEISRHVVARLIMPITGAHALAVGLFDYLKTKGFDPAASEGGSVQ